jgi:hypothetical protein
METRKANIYTDSSAQFLETFSNAPCLHTKWRIAYALNSATVIVASSNGAPPADVKAFETHFSNTVTVLRAQRRQVALRRPYDECNGRFSPFATIAGAMDNFRLPTIAQNLRRHNGAAREDYSRSSA